MLRDHAHGHGWPSGSQRFHLAEMGRSQAALLELAVTSSPVSGCSKQSMPVQARVVLLGHGADELCAGYGRHRTRFRAEVGFPLAPSAGCSATVAL